MNGLKGMVSLIVALCMMFSLCAIPASASDVIDSGKCGDRAYWTLYTDGRLVISGTGAMYDYNDPEEGYKVIAPWFDWYNRNTKPYCEDIKQIIVENGITHIGNFSFNGGYVEQMTNLESISISQTVKTIGIYAFSGLEKLTSIFIPASVEKISTDINEGYLGDAFAHCLCLKEIIVDKENTHFKAVDGVLFQCGDTVSLMHYPRGKEGMVYVFPENVNVVSLQAIGYGECNAIHLPKSVSAVAAIETGGSVSELYFYGDAPEVLTDNYMQGFMYMMDESKSIYYPQNSSGWDSMISRYSHTASDFYECNINFIPWNPTEYPANKLATECETHKYTSAAGNVCTVCDFVYEPQLTPVNKILYINSANVPLRTSYYAKNSQVIRRLSAHQPVTVTHSLYNSLEHLWYKTSDGYYIYSENLGSTQAKVYKVTFDANGSNVKNVPQGESVSETDSFRIPSDKIPERGGYNFLGYSTNKKSETASYHPGSAFCPGSDMTLYAVWAEQTNNYREDIEKLVTGIISGTNPDSKLGDTQKKYWSWYWGRESSDSRGWCAVYASWLVNQVGVSLKSANPDDLVSYLKAEDCYKSNNYQPKTGDLVFLDYELDGSADHVGMIVVDRGAIKVLHGNWGNQVKISSVESDTGLGGTIQSRIMGYGNMEAYSDAAAN